jgi:two-component system phosphate regulon sensor histidine kinase PhoR
VQTLAPLAARKQLTLRTDVAPEVPQVTSDPHRVQQILLNLVHNAIKFTPPSGSVTVAARPVTLEGAPAVELRVVDSGRGIPPDEVPRVFERFYKADRSRQRDGEGTGLGLAIARHVVEAHRGHIRVESEPGRGSTFTVVLPAAVRQS